jgi:ArsR family transcriptional regulator, arsenate/arsenite/antimonite-responsive transcriptional repressor
MAFSKAHLLEEDYILIADLAKALSHPARIKIMHVLLEKQRCVCGDIVDELPLSQSTVSQHLKELKRVGLIDGEIEGPRTCYCINSKKLEIAKEKFFQFFQNISTCC